MDYPVPGVTAECEAMHMPEFEVHGFNELWQAGSGLVKPLDKVVGLRPIALVSGISSDHRHRDERLFSMHTFNHDPQARRESPSVIGNVLLKP